MRRWGVSLGMSVSREGTVSLQGSGVLSQGLRGRVEGRLGDCWHFYRLTTLPQGSVGKKNSASGADKTGFKFHLCHLPTV